MSIIGLDVLCFYALKKKEKKRTSNVFRSTKLQCPHVFSVSLPWFLQDDREFVEAIKEVKDWGIAHYLRKLKLPLKILNGSTSFIKSSNSIIHWIANGIFLSHICVCRFLSSLLILLFKISPQDTITLAINCTAAAKRIFETHLVPRRSLSQLSIFPMYTL